MNVVLPLSLFLGFLGLSGKANALSSQPTAARPRPGTAPLSSNAARAQAKRAAKSGRPPAAQPPEPASARAAVNAAVARSLKEANASASVPPSRNPIVDPWAEPGSSTPPAPVDASRNPIVDPFPSDSERSPKDAALALKSFLAKTHRFGNKSDQPQEIKDAQHDLGVKADGIVGPKTRAAAKKVGVSLPLR